MKKIISILICIFCVLSIITVDVAAEENGNFTYSINSNDEITITGYTGTNKNLVIPEMIDGKVVTGISYDMTASNVDVFDTITISKNINKFIIGWSFVGYYEFKNIKTNQYIVVEDNATYASYDGCLYSKDLTELIRCPFKMSEINYPTNLITISDGAFVDTAFTTIYIPKTVSNIYGNYDFSCLGGCDTLQEIIVEAGNEVYFSVDGVLYKKQDDGNILVKYPNSRQIDNFVIPEGVVSIDMYAFEGNNVKNVEFPSTMTSIGESAFMYCASLETVDLPDNITEIGYYSFSDCESLHTVVMSNNVNYMEMYAFAGCTSLKNVSLSNSLGSLASGVFSTCSSLETIIIPEGIEFLSAWCFMNCENLKDVVIPRSVTDMTEGPFSNCDNVVLNVYEDSYALQYAIDNNMTYKIINDVALGDVNGNGEITFSDAVMILQFDSKILTLTDAQKAAADINGDGNVNYSDAVIVLQKDAGLIKDF